MHGPPLHLKICLKLYLLFVTDKHEFFLLQLFTTILCMSLSPWPPFVPSSPPHPCVAACSPGLAVLHCRTVRMCQRSQRTRRAAFSLLPHQSASKIWQTTHSKQRKKYFIFIGYWYLNEYMH